MTTAQELQKRFHACMPLFIALGDEKMCIRDSRLLRLPCSTIILYSRAILSQAVRILMPAPRKMVSLDNTSG